MRTAAVAGAALLLTLVCPSRASAWGFEAHKYITARAIELLPPELRSFYEKYRDEIVIRSTDPDLWRNVGWPEDPNHFVDFGAKEYGDYPFAALPRELGAAIEKFGTDTIKKNGMLPWRAAEMAGNVRRTFEGFKRGALYGPSDLVLFSGALMHYIEDAHQPFHASINYDGQLTGNNGIHARFERDLFDRFSVRLTIAPQPPHPIPNARDAAFDALLASYQLVDPILAADGKAVAGKEVYDDDYFEKLFAATRPILERRLSQAISAAAGVIIGAWEQAGRPAIPTTVARPPQKVRKPQF